MRTLATVAILAALSSHAVAACYSHADQLAQLETTPKYGAYLNTMEGEFSITIRTANPDLAYIAKMPGGCFAGQFYEVPADTVRHLFTEREWASLTAGEL